MKGKLGSNHLHKVELEAFLVCTPLEDKGRRWDLGGGQMEGKHGRNEGRRSLKPEAGKAGGEGKYGGSVIPKPRRCAQLRGWGSPGHEVSRMGL